MSTKILSDLMSIMCGIIFICFYFAVLSSITSNGTFEKTNPKFLNIFLLKRLCKTSAIFEQIIGNEKVKRFSMLSLLKNRYDAI